MAYIDTKYIGECEFCRHHRHGGCDTWCENGECYRPNMLKIPTADVIEVKHGEWKSTNIPSYFGGVIYECSLCGAKDGDHSSILGYYCWSCGASMKIKEG